MARRRGFTLIELLIVLVVIGVLAAIAIPKYANTKEKATRSAMLSDLRNLATAQEAFFADSSIYATSYGTTVGAGRTPFTPSKGNAVTIVSADGSGWAATVTNPNYKSGASSCGIYAGPAFAASATGAQVEHVPDCQ